MGLFDDLLTERPAVPVVGRALLDTIAGSESPGYNVMYGGGRFEDFTDHPRKPVPITSGPNAGRTSSAAGRYQFLGSTWDEVKKEAGLPDFSPESQDLGAWHLANKTYKTKTGRDLETDLTNAKGNPAAIQGIGRVLSGTWTSLPGGIEPNRATESFAQRFAGAPTEVSAQSRRPTGLFDDLVPAPPPGQEAASVRTVPPPLPSDTGGRFTDTAGENFRTAREGQSPIAPFMANPDASTRYQTWPERLVRGIGSSIASGVTLPGDVLSGQAQLPSSGAVPGSVPFGDADSAGLRVADLAGLGAPVSPVTRAGGTFAGTIRPQAPPPSPTLEANVAAQNIGVDLPRAIGTDSTLTRFMGQVANKMPGGGPMQERVGSAVRQTGDAVAAAAEKAGGAADPMVAGQGFKTGIETSFKPTIRKRIDDAYTEIGNHVDKNFTRPLESTQGVVADIMSRRVASGSDDAGKAVATVLGGVQRPGGLTFEGVKDLRTRVGEMLDTGIFPEGMSQGELRRIYSSLSDDLKATVAASGGDKALAAFNRANAMNKFAEEWKDNLGKVLGNDKSGEGITAALLRTASNGSTGDLKALTMARAAVPKEVWQDVASTAISGLGKDRKGDFSPALFLNDFAKLSDRGKTLLFKDVGSGDVLPHLNDIATVSKKFIEAGKLANTSGTAGHGTAITAVGSGALGFMTGSLVEPLTAISVVVGNNLMARALSRPASAAAVARWSRAYEAAASNPGPRSVSLLNIASRNLANTVNSELGTRVQPTDFMKAIQAPVTGRAEDNQ